jgi:hypothetical protein
MLPAMRSIGRCKSGEGSYTKREALNPSPGAEPVIGRAFARPVGADLSQRERCREVSADSIDNIRCAIDGRIGSSACHF